MTTIIEVMNPRMDYFIGFDPNMDTFIQNRQFHPNFMIFETVDGNFIHGQYEMVLFIFLDSTIFPFCLIS